LFLDTLQFRDLRNLPLQLLQVQAPEEHQLALELLGELVHFANFLLEVHDLHAKQTVFPLDLLRLLLDAHQKVQLLQLNFGNEAFFAAHHVVRCDCPLVKLVNLFGVANAEVTLHELVGGLVLEPVLTLKDFLHTHYASADVLLGLECEHADRLLAVRASVSHRLLQVKQFVGAVGVVETILKRLRVIQLVALHDLLINQHLHFRSCLQVLQWRLCDESLKLLQLCLHLHEFEPVALGQVLRVPQFVLEFEVLGREALHFAFVLTFEVVPEGCEDANELRRHLLQAIDRGKLVELLEDGVEVGEVGARGQVATFLVDAFPSLAPRASSQR